MNEIVPVVSAAATFLTDVHHPLPLAPMSDPFILSQCLGWFLAHVAYVAFTQEDEPGQATYTGPGGDSEPFG